eukprot:Nk52_evm26s163 gene=Nk52_evmTU26s163
MLDLGIMLVMAIMQGIALNHQENPPAVTYNNIEMNLEFLPQYHGTTYAVDSDDNGVAKQVCGTQLSFTVNPAFASRVSLRLWSMDVGSQSAYVMGNYNPREEFLKRNIPSDCIVQETYCNPGSFFQSGGSSLGNGPGPYCVPSNPEVPEIFKLPQYASLPPFFLAPAISENLNRLEPQTNSGYRLLDWCEKFFVSERLVFNYQHGSHGQCNSMNSPIWCSKQGWSFDNGKLNDCQYPPAGSDLGEEQEKDLRECADTHRLMPFFCEYSDYEKLFLFRQSSDPSLTGRVHLAGISQYSETPHQFIRFAISSCYGFLNEPIDPNSDKFLHHPDIPAWLSKSEPFKNSDDLQEFVKSICAQQACKYTPISLKTDHGGLCPESMNGQAKPPAAAKRRDGMDDERVRKTETRRGTITRRGRKAFLAPRRHP